MNYINKYVSLEQETWDKVKEIAARPNNRRPVGIQAGIILKEYVDNAVIVKEDALNMKQIWKDLIAELDFIIEDSGISDPLRLGALMDRRELLEDAFNRVGV